MDKRDQGWLVLDLELMQIQSYLKCMPRSTTLDSANQLLIKALVG